MKLSHDIFGIFLVSGLTLIFMVPVCYALLIVFRKKEKNNKDVNLVISRTSWKIKKPKIKQG